MRQYVVDTSAQVPQAEGCEGILILGDPNTGKGLAITLFRDQAALDAFDAVRQRLTTEAVQHLSATVTEPQVYEVIAQH
jgi:hypothetical protein